MITIRTKDQGWNERLFGLLDRMRAMPDEVDSAVRGIIEQVRIRGDEALFEYTRTFDTFDPEKDGLCFGPDEIAKAYQQAPKDILEALGCAARRIEEFHSHQKEQSWFITDESGTILGQKVTAVDSAGIYVPGGKNAFPSTLLMNVIPAKIAGVENIVVVSPTPARQGQPDAACCCTYCRGGEDLPYRRRPGHSRPGLRNQEHRKSGQGGRPGQHLCGACQEASPGDHRHRRLCRPFRDPRDRG